MTVTPSPQTISLTPGPAVVQLTATLKDSNGNTLTGRTVTWQSLNTSSAQVSSNGLVTGLAPGAVTIQATSEGIVGSAFITVNP